MQNKYLCRIYVSQSDKTNIIKDTFEDALQLLNQSTDTIKTKISWLNMEDIYFNNTNNYIRIIKS